MRMKAILSFLKKIKPILVLYALTHSDRLTKTDTCANSADPDEMACYKPSPNCPVCHSVCEFRLKLLFASVKMSKFKDGRVG